MAAHTDFSVANLQGLTPLHSASWRGHLQVVNALLEAGAEPTSSTKRGWTALHYACRFRFEAIVKLLLDTTAGVPDGQTDINETARVKILEAEADVPGWIVEHGSGELRFVTFPEYPFVELLVESGKDREVHRGWTALHIATNANKLEIVKTLVDSKADVSARAYHGVTTLFIASRWGYVAIVKVFLETGADVSEITDDGWTALHVACRMGYVELVLLLLPRGRLDGFNNAKTDGLTSRRSK